MGCHCFGPFCHCYGLSLLWVVLAHEDNVALGNRLRSGEVDTQMRGVGHWLLPGEVDTRNWGVGHGEPQAVIRGGRHLCSRGRPLVKPGEVDTRSRGVGHGESVVLQWAAGAMGRSVTAMGCHCCVVLVGWTFRTHSWVESIRRMKKGTKHMTACHSPHPLPSSHSGTHTPYQNPHPPPDFPYIFSIFLPPTTS